MSAPLARSALALCAALLCAAATAAPAAKPEKWEPELDQLLAAGKHLAAINLLLEQKPKAAAEPRHLARLVDATLKGYVAAIEFQLFAFKDLAPGETVAALRQQSGTFTIINLGMDERLKNAYRKHATSAELNLAIGHWLDAMEACGCSKSSAMAEGGLTDSDYYAVAERAGLSDARALFRIGVAQQARGDIAAARNLYERSLALDATEVAASYNLAGVLYQMRDFEAAKTTIDGAVGRYRDPNLDADTYQVRGLIQLERNEVEAAERDFRRSLELNPAHGSSFRNLLFIHLKRGDRAAYEAEAVRYISQDLGNTLMFNHYLDELNARGMVEFDRGVEAKIVALDPKAPGPRGAVYFNLARIAWMDGRLDQAEARFRIAREAIVAQEAPPEGAREAIDSALAELAKLPREKSGAAKR